MEVSKWHCALVDQVVPVWRLNWTTPCQINAAVLRLHADVLAEALTHKDSLGLMLTPQFAYRPQELLLHGVIDAWLCSAPDLPDHPDLQAIQLTAMPMHLMVKHGHPLLERGDQLAFADLDDYPVLPLPDGAFPKAQRILEDHNLWSCSERNRRVQQASWFGTVPVEELMITFGTPLMQVTGFLDGCVRLPLSLPMSVGEALVVKRKFVASPICAACWPRWSAGPPSWPPGWRMWSCC